MPPNVVVLRKFASASKRFTTRRLPGLNVAVLKPSGPTAPLIRKNSGGIAADALYIPNCCKAAFGELWNWIVYVVVPETVCDHVCVASWSVFTLIVSPTLIR